MLNFRWCLELQPEGCSVEWMPTKKVVMLPGYSECGYTKSGEYVEECRIDERSGVLSGWDIESCITYKIPDACHPNTWDWTVTCDGSGPDLIEHCPAVPEPSALWLVGIGALGVRLLRRRTKA
jgi:hypothetical protein